MHLLITGGAKPLGRHLAAGLRPPHRVRLTDWQPDGGDAELVACDLGHDEATDRLVEDVDVVLHTVFRPRRQDCPTAWIDANTRRTYNLLLAASQAGVRQAILLSTLDLFLAYDPGMTVSEAWRPRPTCQPESLGPHLAECVAREFAHTHALKVLIVRLGHVVTQEEAHSLPFDPLWVDVRDVVGLVQAALGQELPQFGVVHLQHDSPRARFRHHAHRHSLPYAPQFAFEDRA
ncbi:MAG: NAD(P)-dependent oxidoreductase [Candidatus Latescibacterota bacterium]